MVRRVQDLWWAAQLISAELREERLDAVTAGGRTQVAARGDAAS